MSRRVYLPTSSADLQTLLDGGALDVEGEAAYAVTDALRRAHPRAQDDEELEFLAYAVAVGRAAAPRSSSRRISTRSNRAAVARRSGSAAR